MTTFADHLGVPLSIDVDVEFQQDDPDWIPTPGLGYTHPPGVQVAKIKARAAAPDGKVLELTLNGPLSGGWELLDQTFSESYLTTALEAAKKWKENDPTEADLRAVGMLLYRWARARV